jgi:AcrR family transcriptional regulator
MASVKTRREMYAEETRNALLDEATALFATRGYAGTSLEDVAAASRVTRGAVYHHFSGKRALFEAVLDRMENEAIQQIAAAATAATDAWDAAMLALDAFLERCCDPVYGRVVWQEGPAALGWKGWQECEEKYAYGLIEQFVHGLMDAGYLERKAVETTIWFCFELLGAAGLRLANADEADKPRYRDECADIMRRMLIGLRKLPPGS